MPPLDQLVLRIRGEYREMPGLRLTFAQACRLWQLDGPTCHAALQQLVDERVLCRAPDGAYLALSSVRPKSAKADLDSFRHARARA